MAASVRRRRPAPVRALLAVGLALVGVALVWSALVRTPGPEVVGAGPAGAAGPPVAAGTAAPTPGRTTGAAEDADLRDRVTGPVLPESNPVTVTIPRIGVRSRLVELGLNKDRTMEVPEPSRAGWFTGGPAPGALGPAVLAGHVTWDGAPAIFARLGTLRRGDRVSVTRTDGRTAVFTVSRVARYPKSQFPSKAVYGAIDHAGLRLITCGGSYDEAGKTYLDNVVVFARLDTVRGPRH